MMPSFLGFHPEDRVPPQAIMLVAVGDGARDNRIYVPFDILGRVFAQAPIAYSISFVDRDCDKKTLTFGVNPNKRRHQSCNIAMPASGRTLCIAVTAS